MQKYFFSGLFGFLLLTGIGLKNAATQNYFKAIQSSDQYFNQIIARFPNGDILIGDSFLGPLQNGRENGKVVMARINDCGQKVWAYSYSLSSGYLEIRDFIIGQSGDILAYGSHFNGLEDVLFLLSVNGQTGKNAVFRLYDPETTNGYFAYSLNEIDAHYTAYGLLVNPNTGFVACFDDAFLPLWAKKITPFDPNGKAITSRDKSLIFRSGKYIVKMSREGDIDWAIVLNIPTVNGPAETATGYILLGHAGGYSFFYEIDTEGQLRWKSDMFQAVENSGALSLLKDGNLLFTYNCPDTTDNKICQIVLSANGNIIEHRQLQIVPKINTGIINQSISESNRITLAANANAFVTGSVDVKDFLMQFSLDELTNECMDWVSVQGTVPNTIPLVADSANLVAEDFDLDMPERIEAVIDTFLYPLQELCGENISPAFQSENKRIACEEDWLVWLPDEDFFWLDGSPDNPRVLELTGAYKAKNKDCLNPIEITYNLEKQDCGCTAYVPNAFTPNDDGINDELAFYLTCNPESIQIRVFNRFGNLVYYSDNLNRFWDGRYGQKNAPSGVYVVLIQYQWANADGTLGSHHVYRDVSLLR